MNKLLERALIFAVGAVTGGLPTFFITKKVVDKKHDREFEDLDQYYKEEISSLVARIEALEAMIPGAKVVRDIPADGKTDPRINTHIERSSLDIPSKRRVSKRERVDYGARYNASHDVIDPADEEHPEDDQPESDQGEYLTRDIRNNKGRAPSFIKAADYGAEPGYTSQVLCYYTVNDVLTLEGDQDESLLKDFDEVESMIGDALTRFGFKADDEEVIYIRNYDRLTDYQIIKVFGEYRGT